MAGPGVSRSRAPSSRPTAASLRRSARLNPHPANYTHPLATAEVKRPVPSTPSPKRKYVLGVNESQQPNHCRRSHFSDDRSSSHSLVKRRRTEGERTWNHEKMEEMMLRRTCEEQGIDYSLFDTWVEDPRGKPLEEMKIPFLPNEIMLQIFMECRPETLVECMNTNKRFKELLAGNTKIWRQARLNHYPGLPEVLPLGLDEYELFDLTTGKKCDYCETKKPVRPYYMWSVRCCKECIQSLTLCASQFKRMLKKKVGSSSDWDAHKRELICYTIMWQELPSGVRICWKEEAYARINEAEEMILQDKFEDWFSTVTFGRAQRETFWVLEDWALDVPKMLKKDRDEEKLAARNARKELYITWCQKVLPRPISRTTMEELPSFNTFANKSGFITKKDFILSLPRLIRDHTRFDDETRRHQALERQSRLKHADLLESTVQGVIHALIRDGSAKNWGPIIREQVKAAAASKVELRYPSDTPESVMREWRYRTNDLGITMLYRFAKLIEQALDPVNSPYKDLLHPSVFESFESEEDRIFSCHGLSLQFGYIGPTFHRCQHKELMTLNELAEHFMQRGVYQADLTHLIVGKWEYMIRIAPINGPGDSRTTRPNNNRFGWHPTWRQLEITDWLEQEGV